tara:strand:- start:320 stop:3184 length:2865 start_codon:yes stop_codon:yes gene_type:complete
MAGITQTIPSYTGGISEQPDQLKFPGQVKNVQNAIPDIINGLYKRPGAKRIGTTPLTNVQSGGSWFHYFRDETEGSYIGQVAANGKVRVWSCNDGVEKNVYYEQDNAAYDSSDGDHVSITNYLTTSNSEDIQALTINDTTFLNNRSKTVTTTGTTAGRPDTHFAYVELLRTENGRQYGLNLYNTEHTSIIKRATALRIASDTLDETGGTGTCPGIGTQVFKVTADSNYSGASSTTVEVKNASGSVVTSGQHNLHFRITTHGQQGQIGSYDDNVPDSSFSCSYNRNLSLLHGGEGWETGCKCKVTLTQAKGGGSGHSTTKAVYEIEVIDHEEIAVKDNIKAIRPAPTPFDADTAVTVEAVLGGILEDLPNSITGKVIGNGIYLSSNSTFNVEVVDQDLMRVMGTQINDVTELPIQCRHGSIVKIANTRMSAEDDYYLKFEGENNLDGPGRWVECPAPGIVKSFDATNMPHVLQRMSDGHFLVKKYTWADREVGDNETNPIPSFVGSKINRVLFFRNRLTFLSGENVITSRPGNLTTPNFWCDTALTVSGIDPIDIACSSTFPSDLYDGIEVPAGLLCFSTNEQYLFSSDAEIMNPDTAKLRSVSKYNYNEVVPPISLGSTIGYIDNSNKSTRFMEMAALAREQEAVVINSSELVPTLIPNDTDLVTNSRENNIVLFGKTNSRFLQGFKYLRQGEKSLQAAWFTWEMNNPLKYHFIINDTYYFIDSNNFLQKINLKEESTDPSITQEGADFLIHLDNWTTIGNGSYNATTKLTTFTNQSDWIDQVSSPNGTLVLVDTDANATRVGRYAECTVINNDDFTVPGDWSTGTHYIGYLYDYEVEFPRFYLQKSEGESVQSDVNSKLTVHRMKLNFGKIGLYETTLTRVGKDPYTEVYESIDLDEYEVSDAPYLAEKIKDIPIYERNTNVKVKLKSTHPAPATLRAMSWEGDWSPMHYRRV